MTTDRETARTALHHAVARIPFCGCGQPEEAFVALQTALELFDRPKGVDWGEWWKEKIEPWREAMGNGNALLLLYMLNAARLLDHGGAVSGSWITEDGRRVLKFLQSSPEEGLEDLWADLKWNVVEPS